MNIFNFYMNNDIFKKMWHLQQQSMEMDKIVRKMSSPDR